MKFPRWFPSSISLLNFFIIAFIIYTVIALILSFSNYTVKTITVKSKTAYSSGRAHYNMIIDTNGNTYFVENYIFIGLFNSAEIYGSMDVGKSYSVSTYGVRIPILGLFPNIVKATPA